MLLESLATIPFDPGLCLCQNDSIILPTAGLLRNNERLSAIEVRKKSVKGANGLNKSKFLDSREDI